MANEFKHKTVGSELTQTEFEAVGGHVFDSQATGDIPYASSATQLTRLPRGSANQLLHMGGSNIPEWSSAITATTIDATTDFTVGSTVITDDVITFTPTASDTVTMTAATNGAFSLVTVDAAAAAANIQITADGTVDIDSAGVLTLDSGAAINIEPASGSAILLDGTISIDAGVVTGATSITSTVFVGNLTGNASGTAATVTGATQSAITAVGTLGSIDIDGGAIDGVTIGTNSAVTELQVDYINANASTLTITDSSDTGDLATLAVTTHGATTLTTVDDDATAAHLVLDVDGNIELDSATGIVTIEDGGTEVLRFTESNSGDVTIKLVTNGKDLIFTDNGDAAGLTIKDAQGGIVVPGEVMTTKISYTDGDDAMTIADGGGVTFAQNVTMSGNLTVNGTTTTVDTATLAVEDPLIALATGNDADSLDVGFYGKYVDSGTKYAGLFRDADDSDKWKLFATTGNSHEVPGTTVNTGTGFTLGTLVASAFEGDLTGDVTGNTSGTAATVTGGTQAAITTVANVTEVGALDAGSITSNFSNINIGSSTFDTTGAVSTGNLSPAGDVAIADGKVIKLGGTRPADDEPATGGASGNNTGYGIVVLFDAGAAVAIGDAVSIGADGRVIKTVADATGTLSGPCIGVATTAAGSADDDVYVMTHGVFRHDDWNFGTKGQAVYIEEADPGDLSLTAPNDDGDYAQRVGVAITDDVLLVMPSIDVIEHTGA